MAYGGLETPKPPWIHCCQCSRLLQEGSGVKLPRVVGKFLSFQCCALHSVVQQVAALAGAMA